MKSDHMSIEELLSDESFINYCKKSCPEDVELWESFRSENADNQLLVENAHASFFKLFNALSLADRDEQELLLRSALDKVASGRNTVLPEREEKTAGNSVAFYLRLAVSVAAVLLSVIVIIYYKKDKVNGGMKTFLASYGERKNFQLPDGSIVTLNGGSELKIGENFGVSSRDIYLEGEGYFDVKQNKKLPFIVHTAAMDIMALGTAFNVKAYPEEKTTETSLLKGAVEVTLKEDNNRKMLLHPNQKVNWQHVKKKASGKRLTHKQTNTLQSHNDLMKTVMVTDAGDIKEIAWKENKLIFDDESIEDIAILLERWYGVKIVFTDNIIRHYRFTGTFEKEELSTVLNLLQESKSFKYEIRSGETPEVILFK
ncbi:MAG: FecR family protein [Chitinophagaceae bacterium]|nr:FecR family protein [Chitinophagaceae bacterium]